MFQRMWGMEVSVFVFLTIILLSPILATLPVSAQEDNAIFSVSPGSFTARNTPPMGEPYTIPQVMVVWNRDNVERVIYVTVELPSENMITSGYEPIPNENWVRPFPTSFLIEENSFKEVEISLNIPRWENLTGQRWEVWIPVERQALPGEIGILRPTVRMKIETTEELPSVGGVSFPVLLAVGIASAIIIIAASAWIRSRRKGKRRVGRRRLSRSWR